ncbi:MAG: alkaline phosphatase family protein [Polyangiaceae bacterium]
MALLLVSACTRVPAESATVPVVTRVAAQPSAMPSAMPAAPAAARRAHVIVFVWDGLRPDSVSESITPNLARLRDREGVNFSNHHSVYPTFTMMNAAAFATGAYPGRHGFYGNTEYQPGPVGHNAEGKAIDFAQPVFTEDHGVLQALDAFYGARAPGSRGLFNVDTLFEVAHRAGLRTAAVGKIGPAFLQDHRLDPDRSVILDENVALPLSFARDLQAAGLALPANTEHHAYPDGQTVSLAPNNGKPSAANSEKIVRLKDGATPDPRSALGSAHNAANQYLMNVFLGYVLPKFSPDLSFVWLRNPDSTEHQFGPGSANYLDALRDQDRLLGELRRRLVELGLSDSTDVLVVSDHGHSTVAGDASIFPLRGLQGEATGQGEVGALDPAGYAVSGEVRTADVLQRAGFAHVYDGGGCLLDPVLTGIRKDGSLVYPTRKDTNGSCTASARVSPTGKEKPPTVNYSMPSFRVPNPLPKDAIVIAANGGSEYFYLLDHSQKTAEKLVRTLAERPAYGAIFVHGSYRAIAGTLPLTAIGAEGPRSSPPTPDLIVSFAWNEAALAGGGGGLPGTEYASAQRYRGMHGSFSPRDVHNTLIAQGPHFKIGSMDVLPSGNVDLAPTVAQLLGLPFQAPDGRVLHEALRGEAVDYHVEAVTQNSDPVSLPRTCQADDPGCLHPSAGATYRMTLYKQVLSAPGAAAPFTYLDRASVTRER